MRGLLAVVPLLTMSLPSAPAMAQQYDTRATNEGPVIRGFDVAEVRRLTPGVELNFSLYGTPGGRATLSIEGARRNLTLNETDPGVYEGTYTVGTRDRVGGDSAVTANLRVGNRVASGVLSESLLSGVGEHRRSGQRAVQPAMASERPRIERFDVQGNDDLSPGSELVFSVYGTPGAKVDMAIRGARGVFFLPEVKPGEYSGAYTVRRADHLGPNSVVTANMRMGRLVTTSTLSKPLQAAVAPAPTPRVVRYCSNCATVDAVNVVEVNGDGNYLGTIGGGVVGALLGSQVGRGNGKTAAELAGAVGGAYAGRNIERSSRRTHHYEVVVRYPNGGTQSMTYENDPGLHVGDKVKVNNGVLERDAGTN